MDPTAGVHGIYFLKPCKWSMGSAIVHAKETIYPQLSWVLRNTQPIDSLPLSSSNTNLFPYKQMWKSSIKQEALNQNYLGYLVFPHSPSPSPSPYLFFLSFFLCDFCLKFIQKKNGFSFSSQAFPPFCTPFPNPQRPTSSKPQNLLQIFLLSVLWY